MLLDTLAEYDKFQLDNNIKPDYCNTGGLNVFDANDHEDGPSGSWYTWYDEDGNDISVYALEALRKHCPAWEMADVPASAYEARGI